jgi:biopolymer transport protein ExbD
MNHLRALCILSTIVLLASCEKHESAQSPPPPARTAPTTQLDTTQKAEVKVLSDGAVFLNGEPATLEAIDQKFSELAKAKGVVWYYREGWQTAPPPQATKVVVSQKW